MLFVVLPDLFSTPNNNCTHRIQRIDVLSKDDLSTLLHKDLDRRV